MPFRDWIPENARPGLLLKPHPESGRQVMALTQTLLRGPSSLTPAERELIAAYTSGLNACTFCCDTHTATAEALGVDAGLLGSLLEDLEGAPVAERMKPILRFVRKLTQSPSRMTRADADAIFAAGWDEDAFYHAVSICGLFHYYNRLIEGYGVVSAPDYRRAVGERLAEQGYGTALQLPE